MGHLSQVVELGSMLPHNALKVYKHALTPHPKVSRGWGRCVRQHDDVACKVVKALHAGSARALILSLPCHCAHASRGRIACMAIFADAVVVYFLPLQYQRIVEECMHCCPSA